jgi:Putative auto-transporter adhesin, head GIN domain
MKTLKAIPALLTLATLPLLTTSCMVLDLHWEEGNGVAATEIRTLPSFNRVRLETPVHVTLKSGPAYTAYITSDENLTGYFQTDAFAGTLTVGMSSGIAPLIEPEITIVVPDLREVVHNGNGTVEIQEDGRFPDVTLTLNAGGEIRFSGTASRLRAVINGSGDIVMEGYTALLEADLRGNGEIHGENLLSGDADVDLSGSGYVFLDLDYQSVLNLDLSGSGHVEWWGAPSRLNYNLTGSGKVVEHRGLPKKSAAARNTAGLAKAAGGTAVESAASAGAPSGTAPAYESAPLLPHKVIRFSDAK